MHFSPNRLPYAECVTAAKRRPCTNCSVVGKFEDNEDSYDLTFLCTACGTKIDVGDLLPEHVLYPEYDPEV